MNVTVMGAGYVGLVTAACLADVGNDVVCLDLDPRRIDLLNAGQVPIYEPGLEQVIQRNCAEGRLRFTTDTMAAIGHAQVQFIAVGTPQAEDGSADLSQVLSAADSIGRHMQGFKLVVTKSTVPVGTGDRVRGAIADALLARNLPHGPEAFAVASNPEFLKEGAAIDDFMRPDRIVIGTDPGPAGERARELLLRLYAPFNRVQERVLSMDLKAAELTKYASNAMLATRISFMNELANLAAEVGLDIEQVRKGMGSDGRIGYSFLYAGTGYGGSCFPKDVRALIRTASAHGRHLRVLEAVEAVNEAQKHILVQKINARFGTNLRGMLFGLWGLAFKPNTDDMREAPSRIVLKALLERGAQVMAHDPVAMAHARKVLEHDFAGRTAMLDRLRYADKPIECVRDADALVIVTEWAAFKSPNFETLKKVMRQPIIFDGRNLYDPAIREQGFEYHAIGR
ncbi:MAG TPA: UDP-glucose/GDP-mannose dehydrogenase family protein [Ramlibacter sp.]|jgi:UDPglucose 6-dehydrogenase|uniref:UDP-glucose dehydrogenase family protein n=1 Tax=Ramlibacter sp. TaxID=1917967 RepID=UPI002D419BFF|nr:UDP-glucose/GDP-mannose dehydrogenase family protein [Ramlibacter sp.]HZY17903.1 UDP-glucose/GDP-mannose dehydrogenase family protein [Ramlibacter sp.]